MTFFILIPLGLLVGIYAGAAVGLSSSGL